MIRTVGLWELCAEIRLFSRWCLFVLRRKQKQCGECREFHVPARVSESLATIMAISCFSARARIMEFVAVKSSLTSRHSTKPGFKN